MLLISHRYLKLLLLQVEVFFLDISTTSADYQPIYIQ